MRNYRIHRSNKPNNNQRNLDFDSAADRKIRAERAMQKFADKNDNGRNRWINYTCRGHFQR